MKPDVGISEATREIIKEYLLSPEGVALLRRVASEEGII